MNGTSRRSKRLGKGLSALIPDVNENIDKKDIIEIDLDKIKPNKNQPRKEFDEEKIELLADSIKSVGVLQPIVLKPSGNDSYIIIAGERRYRASRLAGKEKIPAIIKDIPIKDIMEIALIENLQRENLNAIEEAMAYKQLLEDYKVTQEELSKAVGKSRPYIANTIRLLNLPRKIIKMVEERLITPGHGKALLRIEDSNVQIEIAERIIREELSVRDIENLAKKILKDKTNDKKAQSNKKDIHILDVEDRLSNILGTKVNISIGKKKSKIEIEYNDEEDLNNIVSMLIDKE